MAQVKDSEIIDVLNIDSGPVVYSLPDLRVRREFNINEVKKIKAEEIRALYYAPGGKVLVDHYLSVKSPELLKEFGINTEEIPEYNWTDKEVKEVLLNGSLDRLQDALDFGPAGIVDKIKDMAVALEISDINKRKAIQDKTNLNVSLAIENKPAKEDKQENEKPARRSTKAASKSTGRRVAEPAKDAGLPQYKKVEE